MLFSLLLHTSWRCFKILLYLQIIKNHNNQIRGCHKYVRSLNVSNVSTYNIWNQRVMVIGRKMLIPSLSGMHNTNTPYITSCKVCFIRLVTVYCCYYISGVNETYTIHKSVTGITRSGLKRSYLPRGYKFLSKPKKTKPAV